MIASLLPKNVFCGNTLILTKINEFTEITKPDGKKGAAVCRHQIEYFGIFGNGDVGMGDLVLTCTDDQSRNRRMGLALARGLTIDEAKKEIGQEVEGVMTTQAIYDKARKLGIEMPITEQVYRVLYQNLDPKEAVHNLLERKKRQEAG